MTTQQSIEAHVLIKASETKLKEHLMEKYKKTEFDLIHGSAGFPDWIFLHDGKLLCFELKPFSGQKSNLEALQIKTIGILLNLNDVSVFLVKYDYCGEKIDCHGASKRDDFIKRYPADFGYIKANINLTDPKELTRENLKDCNSLRFDFPKTKIDAPSIQQSSQSL